MKKCICSFLLLPLYFLLGSTKAQAQDFKLYFANNVTDVTDFSKIEDGKMEIVPVSYDTALMINDLVNMVLERAEQKNLEFKTEIDRNLPKTLYGDDVRIRQIITNSADFQNNTFL